MMTVKKKVEYASEILSQPQFSKDNLIRTLNDADELINKLIVDNTRVELKTDEVKFDKSQYYILKVRANIQKFCDYIMSQNPVSQI